MITALMDGVARKTIACAKVEAMRSGMGNGLAILTENATLSDISKVAYAVKCCEIFFLDQRFDAALDVYENHVQTMFEKLSPECVALLEDNRTLIMQASFSIDEENLFYHQVDIRKILEIELHDFKSEVIANRAASTGKHHEALPQLWKLLQAAYGTQNWRALQWAHADFAKECLALKWPDEAVWHSIQALSKNLLIESSDNLIASRNLARVISAIDRQLAFSKLAMHRCLAAEFFFNIADCIPDSYISKIIEWVSVHLDTVPANRFGANLFEPTWNLIGRIAHRITPIESLALARKGASSPIFVSINTFRRSLVITMGLLIQHVPVESLDEFVESAIALVTVNKSDIDFVDSVNLVCEIARRSQSCKEKLRNGICPLGKPITNAVLLQISPLLGWHTTDVARLNANVVKVAGMLRNQVQILDENVDPPQLGGFGVLSLSLGQKKIVVHIDGAQRQVDAMLAHLDSIDDQSIEELAITILTLIADDRNIISNRAALIGSLKKMIFRLSDITSAKALTILEQIASGNFKESEIGQTHEESSNPLNPFKMGVGDPRDFRGAALLALAIGSKKFANWSELLHTKILQDYLATEDEKLRLYGVLAAGTSDALSESETIALIASSLDGSSDVRRNVLHGITIQSQVKIDKQSVSLACRAIDRAYKSSAASERGTAVKAAKALLKNESIEGGFKEKLGGIVGDAVNDISSYVRKSAQD